MSKPNWTDVKKCLIWKTLGITECDNCDTMVQCWGGGSVLPKTRSKCIECSKDLTAEEQLFVAIYNFEHPLCQDCYDEGKDEIPRCKCGKHATITVNGHPYCLECVGKLYQEEPK